MPTPAERKALLFIGLVATLGAGARIWQSHHQSPKPFHQKSEFSNESNTDSNADPSDPAPRRTTGARSKNSKKNSRSKRTNPDADSTLVIDLDRATISEIQRLGVVDAGVARMIVTDRDSSGPFGSLEELERVPYLTRANITKLAPRVTFSLLPRPKNTVIRGRADTSSIGKRRSRRQVTTHLNGPS